MLYSSRYVLLAAVCVVACDDGGGSASDAGVDLSDTRVQPDAAGDAAPPTPDAVSPDAGSPDATAPDATAPDAAPRPPPVIVAIESVRREGMHPGDGLACLRAPCPGGKKLLGGGGQWGAEVRLENFGPAVDGAREEGWVICGRSDTAGPWIAEAHCGRVSTRIEWAQGEVRLVAGASGCARAACPDGLVALGGGGSWGGQVLSDANHATREGEWSVCGQADPGATTRVMATAICVEGVPATRPQRDGLQPAIDGVCLSAVCPAGTRVVGGGARWEQPIVRTAGLRTDDNAWTLCGDSEARASWFVQASCVPTGE